MGVTVILLLVAWYAVRRFRVGTDDAGRTLGTLVAPVVLALYLMVAAVTTVIGWNNNDSARDQTTQESTAATDLYWTATTVGGPSEAAIRSPDTRGRGEIDRWRAACLAPPRCRPLSRASPDS